MHHVRNGLDQERITSGAKRGDNHKRIERRHRNGEIPESKGQPYGGCLFIGRRKRVLLSAYELSGAPGKSWSLREIFAQEKGVGVSEGVE